MLNSPGKHFCINSMSSQGSLWHYESRNLFHKYLLGVCYKSKLYWLLCRKNEQNLNMCCFHVAYCLVGEANISQIMISTKMTLRERWSWVPGDNSRIDWPDKEVMGGLFVEMVCGVNQENKIGVHQARRGTKNIPGKTEYKQSSSCASVSMLGMKDWKQRSMGWSVERSRSLGADKS